jgi:uncharacterized protein (TIGR03382 family)
MRTACLIVVLAGCHADPLSPDENIAGWANTASALGVFTTGYEPLAFAVGDAQFADPSCPATADDGTTVTITGGCVDTGGVAWSGSATVVRGAGGALTLTLDAYGNDAFLGPERTTGTFAVVELAADHHAFEVDLVRSGGLTTTIAYSGTVRGDASGPTIWNGAGTISRRGDYFDGGTVEAATVDQLRDDAICPGEGISGRTTMTSAEHAVVIEYDGATDCDAADSARWSRDGVDQGTIEGITCSAGDPGGLGALAVVLVALGRRRRRRARSSPGARSR